MAAAVVRRHPLRLRLSPGAAIRDGGTVESVRVVAGEGVPLLRGVLLCSGDRGGLPVDPDRVGVARFGVAGGGGDGDDVTDLPAAAQVSERRVDVAAATARSAGQVR